MDSIYQATASDEQWDEATESARPDALAFFAIILITILVAGSLLYALVRNLVRERKGLDDNPTLSSHSFRFHAKHTKPIAGGGHYRHVKMTDKDYPPDIGDA